MSLLRFIRRDRTERPSATATAEAPPRPPPEDTPRIDAFAPPPPPPVTDPVDLDRIRRELSEIQRIVGAEEMVSGEVRAPRDAIEVGLKLDEIIRLCPEAFKDASVLQGSSQTIIQVSVPGLYDQLTKGKVVTKVHLLLADIPADYLASYASEHADDQVVLPLHTVVAAIQPEDLRRRTATQERDLGDKALPNIFTAASVAEAAMEKPVPAAPAAEEAALVTTASTPPVVELPAIQPASEPAREQAPVERQAAPAPVVEEHISGWPEVAAPQPEPLPASESVASEAEAAVPPVVEEPAAGLPEVVAAEPEFVPEAIVIEEEAAPPPVVEETVALPAGEAAVPVASLPDIVVSPRESAITAASEAAAQPAAPVDQASASVPAATEAEAEAEAEKAPLRVLLGGLDINSASAEEMHARIDGVGLKLAQRIVACRQADGLFTDLYDLARVSGLRAGRFEQLTGLPWNAAYFRHRELVTGILGTSDSGVPDVRQAANRFNELTDFAGCMIIHEDGLVLAQGWAHPAAESLGAFAPQMFKKIHRYVKPLKLGEMNSICFFVGHQPITVARSGQVYFAALHKPDRLTKKQVSLVQALVMELDRRFARR